MWFAVTRHGCSVVLCDVAQSTDKQKFCFSIYQHYIHLAVILELSLDLMLFDYQAIVLL